MSRPRSLSDSTVLATVCRLLMEGGENAVSFASVGADCGLAASTLAQRYKTRDGMVQSALLDGWGILDARTDAAEEATPMATKSILDPRAPEIGRGHEAEIALLVSHQGDPELRQRADLWSARVENAPAARLDHPRDAGQDSAAMIFRGLAGAADLGAWHWAQFPHERRGAQAELSSVDRADQLVFQHREHLRQFMARA